MSSLLAFKDNYCLGELKGSLAIRFPAICLPSLFGCWVRCVVPIWFLVCVFYRNNVSAGIDLTGLHLQSIDLCSVFGAKNSADRSCALAIQIVG